MTETKTRTWRMRDYGYDANRYDATWFDITAETWEEAVAICLELDRKRVSFTQPITDVRGCSTFAAYVPSPTGGHTKVGCVQVG